MHGLDPTAPLVPTELDRVLAENIEALAPKDADILFHVGRLCQGRLQDVLLVGIFHHNTQAIQGREGELHHVLHRLHSPSLLPGRTRPVLAPHGVAVVGATVLTAPAAGVDHAHFRLIDRASDPAAPLQATVPAPGVCVAPCAVLALHDIYLSGALHPRASILARLAHHRVADVELHSPTDLLSPCASSNQQPRLVEQAQRALPLVRQHPEAGGIPFVAVAQRQHCAVAGAGLVGGHDAELLAHGRADAASLGAGQPPLRETGVASAYTNNRPGLSRVR
mmetsp:Transcript_120943/g.386343  ORF Transcript_120943/g.386343 Transcript_120943/m.386343 type:complete len:279 (-) Transcript_120943:1460-2296(-)